MDDTVRLVVFVLDGQRHAIPLAQVEQVTLAARVTPVPGAPGIVLGLLDLRGQAIPVLDVRRRSAADSPALRLSDQFLVVRTRLRILALRVDDTLGVAERDARAVSSLRLAASPQARTAVLQLDDGLVLIDDVEGFLSGHEARLLDEALAAGSP